ncbi:MAG TPA: hypothetical protein VKE74_15660, partial [Gemmataceae bacterium]|nr:hypothetical protein [Gemmataceae bacterium]
VAGCAAGATLEVSCGFWALALPVALAASAVPLGELWSEGPAKAAQRIATPGEQGAHPLTQPSL